MKSYKKRDVLSAAILGGQENVVLYLMKKKFKGKTPREDSILQKRLLGTHDEEHNNFLHFMYLVNKPGITALIRHAGLIDQDFKFTMNQRG